MKILSFLLFLGVFSLGVHAQNGDVKAKEILSKSIKKYKSYTDFKLSFKLTILDKMTNDELKYEGEFWLKDNKYRINTGEQIIGTNLKKIWVYLPQYKEVQIGDYIEEEQELNPSVFFNFWEKKYLYAYTGDVKKDNKLFNLIELTPENKEMSFYKIKLYIDPSKNELSWVQVFGKNGTIMTFELFDLKVNNKLSNSFFEFSLKEFPGTEITDLSE